jgi:hypothetical protein
MKTAQGTFTSSMERMYRGSLLLVGVKNQIKYQKEKSSERNIFKVRVGTNTGHMKAGNPSQSIRSFERNQVCEFVARKWECKDKYRQDCFS